MPRVKAALCLWYVQRGVVSKGEDRKWEQAGSEPLTLRFAGGGVLAAHAEKLATGLEWLEGALGDSEGLRHSAQNAPAWWTDDGELGGCDEGGGGNVGTRKRM